MNVQKGEACKLSFACANAARYRLPRSRATALSILAVTSASALSRRSSSSRRSAAVKPASARNSCSSSRAARSEGSLRICSSVASRRSNTRRTSSSRSAPTYWRQLAYRFFSQRIMRENTPSSSFTGALPSPRYCSKPRAAYSCTSRHCSAVRSPSSVMPAKRRKVAISRRACARPSR